MRCLLPSSISDRFDKEDRGSKRKFLKTLIFARTVSEHFLCNNHNATDMQLIPLELVKSIRNSVRKAREAYLIERGQTHEPHGPA